MSDSTENAKPIRVLHIGKYFPPHRGGMETYLRDLMSTQTRQGLKVIAVVHSSKRSFQDSSTDIHAGDGVYFNVVRAARWFNLGYVPISPFFVLTLSKQIRAFKPDVIHIHSPNASAAWALAVSGARALPWIIQWHSDILTPSSSWVTRVLYRTFQLIETRLLNKAALILATSKAYLVGSGAIQKYRHKCSVIPLGLDTSRLPNPETVKPQQRPREHRKQLLFLGRLSAYKGVSALLKAMLLLPQDIGLWILGEGEEKKRLKTEIKRLGLAARVELVGNVDDTNKWRYIKSADALVLPSLNKNEAFGVVLLEAGFFGKTLVASDIADSGVGWVARQFKPHYLSKPDDAISLAEALASGLDATPKLIAEVHLPRSVDLNLSAGQISQYYLSCLGR